MNYIKSYLLLLRWQTLRMKVTLPSFAVMQVMMGMGTVIGLSYLLPEIDPVTARFLATGGPTLTILGIGLVLVPQMIANDKEQGIFDYMWSLPAPRIIFLLADLTLWTLACLPGLALALIVGSWYYDFSLQISVLIIPAFVMVITSATMMGYTLAYLSPKPRLTFVMTNIIIFSLFMFSPINYPLERLPSALVALHRVLPVYYMADLIRGNLTDISFNSKSFSFLMVGGWLVIGIFATVRAITRRE